MKISGITKAKTIDNLIIAAGFMLLLGLSSCKTCQCPAYSQVPQENNSPRIADNPTTGREPVPDQNFTGAPAIAIVSVLDENFDSIQK